MERIVEFAGCGHDLKAPVRISVYRNDRFHRPSVIPGALFPAGGGPGKRKTSRGCERSARGSRTTVSTRTWSYVVVTADRRACCQ
ncbi:hypothetical protein EZV63_25820 [Streptomyces sp. VN1]|nr:hypothetical protein EZV63_25820 [Streptomyces sp. VN1]